MVKFTQIKQVKTAYLSGHLAKEVQNQTQKSSKERFAGRILMELLEIQDKKVMLEHMKAIAKEKQKKIVTVFIEKIILWNSSILIVF